MSRPFIGENSSAELGLLIWQQRMITFSIIIKLGWHGDGSKLIKKNDEEKKNNTVVCWICVKVKANSS